MQMHFVGSIQRPQAFYLLPLLKIEVDRRFQFNSFWKNYGSRSVNFFASKCYLISAVSQLSFSLQKAAVVALNVKIVIM